MQKRPWLILVSVLWALTLFLAFITCATKDIGIAVVTAVVVAVAGTITLLVVGECLMQKLLESHLDRHREKMAAVVVAERVSVENLARAAAQRTAAHLAEVPRPDRPRY